MTGTDRPQSEQPRATAAPAPEQQPSHERRDLAGSSGSLGFTSLVSLDGDDGAAGFCTPDGVCY